MMMIFETKFYITNFKIFNKFIKNFNNIYNK